MFNPVNQTQKHVSTSERYQFVSTTAIKEHLQANGFVVWKEQIARVRKPDRQGYQKHTLKCFRACDADLMPTERPNEHVVRAKIDAPAIPMLIITNSHDGRSGVVITGGFFRVLCNNGLVVSESTMPSIHISHIRKNIVQEVYESTYKIAAQLEQQAKVIDDMKNLQLADYQRTQFAYKAMGLLTNRTGVTLDAMLEVKRQGDEGTDLWTVFNRVQEHVIMGGLKPENGRRLRAVTAIKREIQVNQQLWDIATEYLKAA